MKKKSQILAIGLCMMLCSHPLQVLASPQAISGPMGENQTPAQKMGVSEEEYQRYMDNRLEYGEIDALVHFFNPTISTAWKNYQSNIEEIERNISDLEAGQMAVSGLAENAKNNGDFEDFGMYKVQERALDQMVKSLNKSKKSLGKDVSIGNESLRNSERQVSHAVKTLMVNYLSLNKQLELLKQSVTLSEQLIQISKTTTNIGASTMQAVTRANSEFARAKSDLERLNANAQSMRRTLITMLGWDVNASPEILDIRVEDYVNRDILSAMDLESDIRAAIGNNYALIDVRRNKTSKNFTKADLKKLTEEQMEGNVRNDVTNKYQQLQSAMQEYEAKQTARKAGEWKENSANTKLRLGMLSQIQYNESALEYNRAKINAEVSGLQLLLAYLEYSDAIHGNANAE